MTSDSVALLTFGSPLHRLYGRNFPAYFDFDTLDQLRASGPGRWLNLWAYSDPIGGWVFHGGRARISAPGGWMHRPATPDPTTVDLWLPDATGALPKQGSYPPICHHSGFWLRPEYEWAVDRLAARIAVIPGRIGTVAGLVNLIEPRTTPSASVPVPLRLPSAAE
jgi:hypothetical protein